MYIYVPYPGTTLLWYQVSALGRVGLRTIGQRKKRHRIQSGDHGRAKGTIQLVEKIYFPVCPNAGLHEEHFHHFHGSSLPPWQQSLADPGHKEEQ